MISYLKTIVIKIKIFEERKVLYSFFKQMGHSRPLFLYFRLFTTFDSYQCSIKTLLMTGFEPRTFGFGSNCFTN